MFLDLVEYIAGWSRDAPMLLLCLARPELIDERPAWSGQSITLEPLSGAPYTKADLVARMVLEGKRARR